MQHLPLPVTAAGDEAVVNELAEDAFWAPHVADWIAAYRTYQAGGGSPFAVSPHNFGAGVGSRQYSLFDSRGGSGELRRMRRKEGLKSCPVCGSPVTGNLDHYLPRNAYPEFAIMRANLVPACQHCNSGVKGKTIHGGNPRRFIHPYFDPWAAQPIWLVEIIPPYKAATFRPRPLPELQAPNSEIVSFHLENVLGIQFDLSMANHWSSLPGQLKMRDETLTSASVTHQVNIELILARLSKGENSWDAALLRGIASDAAAIEHLRQEAIGTVLPPMA
ncbi:hypothetical protein [Methylobacterium sp. 37f]|uniref:HNH endonuclease n=1 Tax=Methylobacterium sp. 37f TaxID=2817058 RepID=UPI001FFD0216|nr:hypothetical protein [Methylobacterium sp. 37f]MCK2053805.1 HNH endonuclease [Methylobacterium sp. 37f]